MSTPSAATSESATPPASPERTAAAAPPPARPDDPPVAVIAEERPWTWGRARDIVWTLLGISGLVYVFGWAIGFITSVLLLLVLASLLAFIIWPVVRALERWLRLSRAAAALVAYAVTVVLLLAAGAWGITQLYAQITAAITNLPTAYQGLQSRIPNLEARAAAIGITIDIRALQARLLSELQSAGFASHGLAWAASLGDIAANLFLVVFLSFYLVIDGERLGNALIEITPARWKPHMLFLQKTLWRVVGGYVRGQLTMGAIIGLSVFVASLVLGLRYSVLLGLLGFFFEMIPMIGPTLIGICMTAIAALESFKLALVVLAFYIALQTVESNVLGPRITGHAVGLLPIASMLGLVAGAKLFGLWGALFAVPVLGFAFVIIAAIYRQLKGLDPIELLAARRPPPARTGWPRWVARAPSWPGAWTARRSHPSRPADDGPRPLA